MGKPIKQGAGEPLRTKDLRPFLERQVSGHHQAMMLIGPADNLEEQLGSRLGERNVSQFIDDQEMESLELFVHSLKPSFFSTFHELSDQVGGCVESDGSALGACRKRQGTGQVSFASSGVPDE